MSQNPQTAADLRAEARALDARADKLEQSANESDCGCEIVKTVISTGIKVGVGAAIGLPISLI